MTTPPGRTSAELNAMRVFVLTLFTLVFPVQGISPTERRSSPCPDVFTYEAQSNNSNKEDDRWYGVIYLRTQEDLSGVWVHVLLDRPAELLGNWFGEATSSDNQEYIIKNPKYHLEAGPPVSLRFFVKYNPASTIPSVTSIRLNGKTVCGSTSTTTHRPQLHLSQPTNGVSNQNSDSQNNHGSSSRPNRRPVVHNDVDNIDRPRPSSTNTYDNIDRPYRPTSGNNYDNVDRPSRPSSNTYDVETNRPSSRPRPSNTETFLTVDSNTGSTYPVNNVDRPSRPNRPGSGGSSNFGNNNNREPSYGEDGTDTSNTGTGLGHTGGYVTTTDDYDFFPGDFALSLPVNRPSSSRPSVLPSKKPSCGTVALRPSPLITYGQNTSEGQWPWHAALYHSQGIQLTYTCGASLLSEYYVITAAHCVTKPQTNKAINPQNLLVYLGKHNLKKFGAHIQDIEVEKIIVHPHYNSTVFHNDIAILRLGHAAEITNYVRPVCLWEESTDLNSILNRLGTVVGWGFDQNRKITSDLMQASMPIVQSLDCVYSNPDFFSRFTFDKSYCAGFRNGTSVCNGDSGGGMVFPKPGTSGHNTVWQLRGLVSVGVALQGQTVCDTSHYIVFTDVAKHLEWIRSVMNQN